MKFTVEVEDFYLEEDDLSSALTQSIKNEVVAQIRKTLEAQVVKLTDDLIKKEIGAKVAARVDILTNDYVEKGMVQGSYSSEPPMSVSSWIAKRFESEKGNIHKMIEAQVKTQVTELQRRYDLLFATQIVSSLNKQGMLKDDIAKLLLEDGSGPKS